MPTLEKIDFARELMAKWRIDAKELEQYMHNGLLTPYYYPPGKPPKIELAGYNCDKCSKGLNGMLCPQVKNEFDFWETNWSAIVFDAKQVEKFEQEHLELLDKSTGNTDADNRWITSNELIERWKMSPLRLCELLNKKRIKSSLDDEWTYAIRRNPEDFDSDPNFYNIEKLSEAKFHIFDIKDIEEYANNDLFWAEEINRREQHSLDNVNTTQALEVGNKKLEYELAEASHKISSLEAEIDRLKESQPAIPKTAKAKEARDASTQHKWIGYSTALVRLAFEYDHCCKGRPMTRAEILDRLRKDIPGIPEAALEAFMAGLPQEKKKGPGAPPQA
ncbi:MAG: hypothetical protein HQK81_10805 [Desulfovibrionaceae bacterium]|nr:hypothetical protein [Desulfovibrionaceae bacterium]MBF0514531.1 hypothetical protein [Desulfovibrionaceae bacterium]